VFKDKHNRGPGGEINDGKWVIIDERLPTNGGALF
jgi:hypothetical protein